MARKILAAGGIVATILALDIMTKRWALDELTHGYTLSGFGDLVPLTLIFNEGVAFGLSVGGSRWFIIAATFIVLGALLVLFRQARDNDWLRVCSLAMVIAGALGNLVDRMRWERGVVDFIGPFDLGLFHFPIFNVADMAITVGAAVLAISLWLEERKPVAEPTTNPEATEAA